MEAIVLIILQIFFCNTRRFENWGILNNYPPLATITEAPSTLIRFQTKTELLCSGYGYRLHVFFFCHFENKEVFTRLSVYYLHL